MQAKDETPLAVAAGTPASLMKPQTGCKTAHIMLVSAMEWQEGWYREEFKKGEGAGR
jgi:hypothetical protein